MAPKRSDIVRQTITHENLLEHVWGPAHRQDLDYLRVAVRALRKKVEADPASYRLIINKLGVGYRIAIEARARALRSSPILST